MRAACEKVKRKKEKGKSKKENEKSLKHETGTLYV